MQAFPYLSLLPRAGRAALPRSCKEIHAFTSAEDLKAEALHGPRLGTS